MDGKRGCYNKSDFNENLKKLERVPNSKFYEMKYLLFFSEYNKSLKGNFKRAVLLYVF